MIDSRTIGIYRALVSAFTKDDVDVVFMYATKTDSYTHAFEFSFETSEKPARKLIFLAEFVEDMITNNLTLKISCKCACLDPKAIRKKQFKRFGFNLDTTTMIATFTFTDIEPLMPLKIDRAFKECLTYELFSGNLTFVEDTPLVSPVDVKLANRDLITVVTAQKIDETLVEKPKRKKRIILDNPPEEIRISENIEELTKSTNVQTSLRPIALEIGEEVKKHVFGQDDYIERLALLVQEQLTMGKAKPLLVIGKSGCGKTFTIEMLMEYCKKILPSDYEYIYADCAGLTEKGYTGGEVSSIFNSVKASRGIIFLDEIDKIIRVSTNSKGENTNLAVQNEIMNYVSGKIVNRIGKNLDTSKFLFVLGGAFPDLYELHNQKKHSFGFAPEACSILADSSINEESVAAKDEIRMLSGSNSKGKGKSRNKGGVNLTFRDTTKEAVMLRNDLVSIGASREFMGRVGTIITLRQLNVEDFRRILVDSVIPEKLESTKKCYNIVFNFSDRAIDSIIESAMENEYGARIIKTTVDNLIDSVVYPTITEAENLSGKDKSKVTPIALDIDFEDDHFNYCVSLMDA